MMGAASQYEFSSISSGVNSRTRIFATTGTPGSARLVTLRFVANWPSLTHVKRAKMVDKMSYMPAPGHPYVVACLGSSSTAGKGQAFNWIGALQNRLGQERFVLRKFRFLAFYRDAFRTLVLGRSPDEVSRLNGWEFHTDGVHLNSRGGLLLADLVQTFIEKDGKSAKEDPR
jgi:hypothetical protein